MLRTLALAIALLSLTVAPVRAGSDLTQEQFLQGTGSACLTGGILIGLAALAAGPAAASAAMTTVAPAQFATGTATFLGCGAGAAAALTYYGITWTYGTFFGVPRYPLLYPLSEKRE